MSAGIVWKTSRSITAEELSRTAGEHILPLLRDISPWRFILVNPEYPSIRGYENGSNETERFHFGFLSEEEARERYPHLMGFRGHQGDLMQDLKKTGLMGWLSSENGTGTGYVRATKEPLLELTMACLFHLLGRHLGVTGTIETAWTEQQRFPDPTTDFYAFVERFPLESSVKERIQRAICRHGLVLGRIPKEQGSGVFW